MGKWWIWVLEWVKAKYLRKRLPLWFSLNKAQIRRSSSIQSEESSITQGWVSLSLMTFTVVYKRLYSSNILPAATRPGCFASHVIFDFWANLNGCGWNFKRSGWNFGIALRQLSLPYIIILRSFVVNFLNKKLSRFFIKLLSRFFRRLLFNFNFFWYIFFFYKNNAFGCKFRAALATTSRRPLRNAVIPARRRKRGVDYEKIT